MKRRAIAVFVAVFMFLIASGYTLLSHGAPRDSKPDLFAFPEYRYGPADKVWNEVMGGIAKAEAEYVRAVLRRGGIAPERRERITGFRDEAIYWDAVAKVLIYHSDFDAAREAGKKAEGLLRQMVGLVLGEKA
jgi:hypothetical protein